MTWVDLELVLVGLAAMLEPATIVASVLALVVGDRPLRTGSLFYLGGLGVTLAMGVLAAFVLGNAAASATSTPKPWVSVFGLIAGVLLLVYVVLLLRRPADPDQLASTTARMTKVATAPPLTIVAAGAVLANPGVFTLIALKNISQLNTSTAEYVVNWTLFALASLLPLGVGLVMLLVAPGQTESVLTVVRAFVERRARAIIAVILTGLAVALLRDAVIGLL